MTELEQIKTRVNLVDLIGESVTLKKAGRNFKGLCPFHTERSPSFIVSPDRQIWHCFGCFPPGEFIKTPFGYHAIETLDTNHWVVSGKGRYKKIERVLERNYQGELIELVTKKLRYKTRLTSDHNVLTLGGAPYTKKQYKNFSRRYRKYLRLRQLNAQKYNRKIEKYFPIREINARELKPGDVLLYPIQRTEQDLREIDLSQYYSKQTNYGPVPKKLPKVSVDENFLKLIGYYIAEGSNHRAYIRFSLGSGELDFAKEIAQLIEKIFGLQASIHIRTGIKTGLEVTTCHAGLANIFENLCGKGAASKHIPFIFQELPKEKLKVLLEAIWKGDGTSFIANKSRSTHCSITSISRILIEQLTDLLLRLNFFPSIHIHNSKIDKNDVHHRTAYTIFWSKEGRQRYGEVYYTREGIEYWILPIESIHKTNYQGPVYNLTVADDHSYMVSHFAVGNCGKGGDHFTFMMELEHMEFSEALKLLAQRAGVTLSTTPQQSTREKEREQLLMVHRLTQEFYSYLLTKHPIGARAREYLQERGVIPELITTFSLGFAPNAWDNLAKFLSKKKIRYQVMERAGLVMRGRNSWYDRFRNRIMFALKNHRGETVGFSGRLLDGAIKEAKYINSPETPIYIKGEQLYGLDITKEPIRKANNAIVVEGEFDVISSFHAGITNVVAIKGSALTETQVSLLKRFTDRVTLALDQDSAGDAASRRGIGIAEAAGLDIRVVTIPEGKDPDEAARQHPELWKKAVAQAVPYYDFILESAAKRYDIADPYGKKKISDEFVPVLFKITNSIVQGHYSKQLADLLGISETAVSQALEKYERTQGRKISAESAAPAPTRLSREELLEEHLLAFTLQNSELTQALEMVMAEIDPSDLMHPVVKKIFMVMIDHVSQTAVLQLTEIAASMPTELKSTFDRLSLVNLEEFENAELVGKEFTKTIALTKRQMLRRAIKTLSAEITQAQKNGDEAALTRLKTQLEAKVIELKRQEK